MSDEKLQKLSYYAVAWGWALFNRSIISDDHFEAWVRGPVSPKLSSEYKDYGWNPIPQVEAPTDISQDLENLLESVWTTYGDKSANELEALTHTESPWKNAYGSAPSDKKLSTKISSDDMHKFYLSIYNGD